MGRSRGSEYRSRSRRSCRSSNRSTRGSRVQVRSVRTSNTVLVASEATATVGLREGRILSRRTGRLNKVRKINVLALVSNLSIIDSGTRGGAAGVLGLNSSKLNVLAILAGFLVHGRALYLAVSLLSATKVSDRVAD